MKKILAILLILVLALTSMVSCDKVEGVKNTVVDKFNEIKNNIFGGKEEGPTLDDAKTYLFNTYKDSSKNTLVDYDVVAKVIIDGTTFNVTWTASLETITIKESTKANFWTVDLPAANDAEAAYVLTATIADADGNKVEVKFDKVLPAYKENTNVAVGPQVGKAYNLSFYHPGVDGGSTFYIVGYMNGYYFQTSTDTDDTLGYKERVNVYVEETEGGYYMYCMYYGAKLYIDMYVNGNYVNGRFAETPGVVYTYNETLKTYVATLADQEYMFGVKTAPKDDGSYYTTIGPVPTNAPDSYYWLTFVESTVPDLEAAEYTTPEEIVNAAYALEEGKTLYGGKFTLTGVITQVTDAYTSQYKNVTVIIKVGDMADKPITCYRIKGTGADQIAVGDTITVTGIIVNYKGTIEFNSGSSLDSFTKGEGGEVTPPVTVNPVPTPVIPEGDQVIFDFGANGDAVHADGEALADGATSTTYTSGDYTLNLTDVSNVQFGGFDAKGNSFLKFGNSSAAGTITFVVPDDVKAVVIYAARYKHYDNNNIIVVNGTTYSLAKNSDDGEYEAIVVDTTTNKTVVIASAVVTSGKPRMVINTITYVVAACDHNYESVETNATCTTAGKITYTCSHCGDSYVEAGDAATNHVGTTTDTAETDSTCLVKGYTAGVYCSACEEYIDGHEEKELAGHSYGEDNKCIWCGTLSHTCDCTVAGDVVDPTCTTDGYTVYHCYFDGCPTTENKDVQKAAHTYGEGVPTAPTCVAAGYTTYTCTVCTAETEGHTKVEDGEPATGIHTPGAEATCTTAQTCTVCTAELVAAKGHKDEDGDFKCDNNCGTVVEPAADSVLTIAQAIALGKNYGHGKYTTNKYYITGIVVELTNTVYGNFYLKDADGNKLYVYGLYGTDGSTKYEALEVKPVNGDEITVYTVVGTYSSSQQTNYAQLVEIVTVHGDNHNYSSVVNAPTCLEDGYTLHTCSICGGSYKDTIVEAPGSHDYGEDGACTREGCNATQGVKVWEKASSIAVGDIVTLVYETGNMELSGFSSTSTVYGTGAQYTDGVTGAFKLTVVAGSTDGTFAFQTEDGQYLSWTSGNSLKGSTTLDANSSWNVEFDTNGNAVITNAKDPNRKLQWNANSPRFATYTSTQTAIQIYVYR